MQAAGQPHHTALRACRHGSQRVPGWQSCPVALVTPACRARLPPAPLSARTASRGRVQRRGQDRPHDGSAVGTHRQRRFASRGGPAWRNQARFRGSRLARRLPSSPSNAGRTTPAFLHHCFSPPLVLLLCSALAPLRQTRPLPTPPPHPDPHPTAPHLPSPNLYYTQGSNTARPVLADIINDESRRARVRVEGAVNGAPFVVERTASKK